MSMRQEMRPDGDLLMVCAAGEFSLEEAKRIFLEMMEAAARHGSKQVLLDGRTITGNPKTIERFFYGEFAAQTVAQHQTRTPSTATRFAYVLREPVLDPQKFGETVAVNRGMDVRAFDSLEEALRWLAKPGPKELSSKLPPVGQHVMVQGQGFRCIAYRDQDGNWRDAYHGDILPNVIKVIPEF
jgi:hypothetical protein